MSRVEELVALVFKTNGMGAEAGREAHRAVVAEMADGYLVCKSCHSGEELDAEKVNRYLDHGWPLCCGATMAFHDPAPAGGER